MREFSNVLGVHIDRLDTRQVMARLEEFISSGKSHQVVYINVDGINRCLFDKRYRKIVEEADLVYPDGMGVVWASKLTHRPLSERVNAGDFLPWLCQLCREKGHKIYLLGGQGWVGRKAAENLCREFPGLEIAGTHSGFFQAEEEEEIIDDINRSGAHILLVGLGVPYQEKWIKRNLSKLKPEVCWGVGGLFDYYSLRIRRAPVLLRKLGLEWAFRLGLEPRRLWRRYMVGNFIFISRLFASLILDAVLISIGWISAYWIRYAIDGIMHRPINPFQPYFWGLPGIIILWLLSCTYFGLYKLRREHSKIEEFSSMVKTVLMGLLVAMAFSFLFKEFEFGRSVVLLSGFLNLFLLGFSHWIMRKVDVILSDRYKLKRVLIVGTGKLAHRVRREVEDSPTGYHLSGFVSEEKKPLFGFRQQEIVGDISRLGGLVKDRRIDEIWVATEGMDLSEKMNLIARWKDIGCELKIVSEAFRPFAARVRIDRVGGIPLFDLPRSKISLSYQCAKTVVDFFLSLAAIILSAPFWLLIAAAIKLESPGRVVFAQKRVGKDGKIFRMYKFRTMFSSTDKYAPAPERKGDPRITKVGRFLRHWSLDELPQLLNVLKGEMSMVGPRPEMVFIVEDYQPWEKERLSVKPGITGLWQVAGRKDLPLHKHTEYDFYYIMHRSIFLDAVIILKTIPAVLRRRGAY